MKCPNDQATLVMSERKGIEIDYCPECRGVWLDKGELDKMIEQTPAVPHIVEQPQQSHRAPHDYEHTKRSYDDHPSHYKKKRKESFLGDLFDF